MAGLHTFATLDNKNSKQWKKCLDGVLYDERYQIKQIFQSGRMFSAISHYPGYPFLVWHEKDFRIVLEGMVYNKSENDLKNQLFAIAKELAKNEKYQEKIKSFVQSADGDFIVQIEIISSGQILIFNDYFGRLPLYYFCQNNSLAISREINTILNFLPKISFNKIGLAEHFTFGFTRGNRTIFDNIFRLNPSEMLLVNQSSSEINLEVKKSCQFNFILKKPFLSKTESIEALKTLFLESTKNRVLTLEKGGYKIVADLSGGYDTRSVLGGLGWCKNDVSYFLHKPSISNYENKIQIVKKLGAKVGSLNKLQIIESDHSFDAKKISQLIYQTAGLVEYSTTFPCFQDSSLLRQKVPQKAGRFMGFGGEFTRRPNRAFHRSLIDGISSGIYTKNAVRDVCKLLNLDQNQYYKNLHQHFAAYPERTREEKMRRFYYEYYNNFVNAAGEERARIHFWTLQPLWATKYLKTVFARVPLSWMNFSYFIQFLASINPDLLAVPIFGSRVNLRSKFSVWFLTFWQNLKIFFKSNLASIYVWARELRQRKFGSKESDKRLAEIQYYVDKISFTLPFKLEKKLLRRNPTLAKMTLTMLMYFFELDKRHHQKFK